MVSRFGEKMHLALDQEMVELSILKKHELLDF